MRSTILFALVLAGAPVAVTAQVDGSPAAAAPGAAGQSAPGAERMICRREQASGSRLGAKRICQTAAEWERRRREDQQATEKIQNGRWKSS